MSEPARPAEGQTVWHLLRDLLHLRGPSTLRESIEEAIEEHAEDGLMPGDLDADERVMLRNMLQLGTRKAGDIAVPRSDMVAIPVDVEFRALTQTFRSAEHSRLPVYEGSLDDVIGMLHVKDIYGVIADRFESAPGSPGLPSVRDLLRSVLFVPPSMPLLELLTRMRRRRTHMAILVDEYGGTDGLITIEDVVEEIVGEIEDEYDEIEPEMIIQRSNGSLEADARVDLDELERRLGISFVDHDLGGDVDTLGGLAVLLAARIPQAGEKFLHPNGWTVEVIASDARRVQRLRLYPPQTPAAPDTPGAPA